MRLLTVESPDPFDQDDVSLAQELASRTAVCVDNARRYAKERTTAVALQRSLLPQAMAGQVAGRVRLPLPSGAVAGGRRR